MGRVASLPSASHDDHILTNTPGPSGSRMQRIVVLNPKGGSGKTTLAINLAAYFAGRGDNTLLIDRDPQGSSTRWLRKRKMPQPVINGIATFERDSRTTMSWQMRVPDGTQKIVVDSPAAIEARSMPELVRDAQGVALALGVRRLVRQHRDEQVLRSEGLARERGGRPARAAWPSAGARSRHPPGRRQSRALERDHRRTGCSRRPHDDRPG